jgi:hypothetical protein
MSKIIDNFEIRRKAFAILAGEEVAANDLESTGVARQGRSDEEPHWSDFPVSRYFVKYPPMKPFVPTTPVNIV